MEFTGIEKISLVDYEEKVACILFFNGCNFHCPFCHNGLTLLNDNSHIPFEDIIAYLKQRKGILDAVVISGGEPTLMPDLKDKIKTIKSFGLLVKLDTNGSHPEVIKDLLSENLIDYIAMDIKNSESKYSLTCDGDIDIKRIKESINLIINSNIKYEFRTTLIKEFHTKEDIKDISNLIKGAEKYYLQKFVSREGCFNKDLHEVDIKEAEEFKEILKANIKEVNLRGY